MTLETHDVGNIAEYILNIENKMSAINDRRPNLNVHIINNSEFLVINEHT